MFEFHLMSIFYLLLIPIIWYKSKTLERFLSNWLILVVITGLFIEAGYFIDIGKTTITYYQFTLIVFIIAFLGNVSFNKKFIINYKLILLFSIFLTSIFFSYLALITTKDQMLVIPRQGSWDRYLLGLSNLTNLNQISPNFSPIKYILVYFIILNFISKKKNIIQNSLIKLLMKTTFIISLLALFEFIIKIIGLGNLWISTVNYIFGINDLQQLITIKRLGLIHAVNVFCTEPRHFATSMIPGIFLLLERWEIMNKEKIVSLVVIIIALLISTSLTAVGIIIICLLLLITKIKNRRNFSFFITLVLLILIISVFFFSPIKTYYQQRTELLTFQKNPSLFSVKKALEIFTKHPLFGIGLETTIAYGFLPSMLANIGIFGTLSMFLLFLNHRKYSEKIRYDFLIAFLVLSLLSGSASSYISAWFLVITQFVIVESHFEKNITYRR